VGTRGPGGAGGAAPGGVHPGGGMPALIHGVIDIVHEIMEPEYDPCNGTSTNCCPGTWG